MGYHPPPYLLQPYTHQFPGFIPPPSYPPFTQHCNLRPSTSHLVPSNQQFVQRSSEPPHMVHQQQMAYPTQSTLPSSPPHSTINQPSTIFNQAQRDHPEQQTTMRQISAPQPADVHIQAVANSTKSVHKEKSPVIVATEEKTPVNLATKITVQRTQKTSNNSINNIIDSEKKFKEGSINRTETKELNEELLEISPDHLELDHNSKKQNKQHHFRLKCIKKNPSDN